MAEVRLFQLPAELRGRRDPDFGMECLEYCPDDFRIAGFIDQSVRQSGVEGLVWPRPLMQLGGRPLITHNSWLQFTGHMYDSLTKFVCSRVVMGGEYGLEAKFSADGRGRVGSFKDDLLLRIIERGRGPRALEGILPDIPTAYLFQAGPTAYDQEAFESAVKASIIGYGIQVELVS
jgi:hypothetical protein